MQPHRQFNNLETINSRINKSLKDSPKKEIKFYERF